MDDIESLSELALQWKTNLHVDCCVGGFVLPFLENKPKFDFRLPGVSSISCDPHKYGQSPKGISVLLYRTNELRALQYYLKEDWTGGIYGTPGIIGSRSSGPIAGGWFALVYNGFNQ